MSDSDDDVPQLSAATLAALQEFYDDQKMGQGQATDIYAVGAVEEDWGMSQFWYNEETATAASRGGHTAGWQRGQDSMPQLPKRVPAAEKERPGGHQRSYRRASVHKALTLSSPDPPYLSEECLSKVAITVKFLTKGKTLLCTGAIMEEHAKKLMALKMCNFLPKHSHNLANEFRCYTNYESTLLS
ncbi:hypothetical protein AALO_G00038260 [Alosa alosa]|uniref:Uncharacterized protein n=1 Tax=Alosa alosa TaxID=278164 RepID=A0AAV6HAB7_9TELE|nr:hypothetical protein AALO_G00038260 [Alosa alosa]